jgi:hypothetical protein
MTQKQLKEMSTPDYYDGNYDLLRKHCEIINGIERLKKTTKLSYYINPIEDREYNHPDDYGWQVRYRTEYVIILRYQTKSGEGYASVYIENPAMYAAIRDVLGIPLPRVTVNENQMEEAA